MSKKLLNEHTVRRFMKLAGTEVLASDFVKEGSVPASKNDLDGTSLAAQGGNDEFGSSKEYPGKLKKQPVTDLSLGQGSGKKGTPVVDKGGNSTMMEQPEEEDVMAELPPEEEMAELPPEGEELPPEGEELPPEEAGAADVDLSDEEAEVLVNLGQRLADELGMGGEEELPPEEEMAELPPEEGEGGMPPELAAVMGGAPPPEEELAEAQRKAFIDQVLYESSQQVKHYLNALREQQQAQQLQESREARKRVLAEDLAAKIFQRLKTKGGK